jgi:apolipoprotein N-acyltransferase
LYALFWLGPYLARLFGTEFGPFFTYLGVLIAILNFFMSTERKFHEATAFRWFVLQGVLGWVGFEMVRATFIPVLATSAFIGYTQSTQAWLFQPVAIFSVYAFDLLMLMVNFVAAQALLAFYDRRWQPAGVVHVDAGAARRWLAITGIAAALWLGLSLVMLNTAPKEAPSVRIASLRSGFPLPAFQDEINTGPVRFDTFARQARQAAQQGAQVLFTSEMMFNFDPQAEYASQFRSIARETNTYIFIAYTIVEEGQPFRNETVLLSPSGDFSAVYAKNHNPPGEPLSPSAGVYPVFETPFGRMAALICHDANYTDVTRRLAGNGAQLVAAGFREFRGYGEQLWTNATFRAVENHVAMVVTGAAYASAIIDPYGRQIALDSGYEGGQLTMVGDVPLGTGPTPYTSSGDVLGWVSLAGFAFFIVFQSVLQRRAGLAGRATGEAR